MLHNDARGGGKGMGGRAGRTGLEGTGVITYDVLKMRKVIEFQPLCPATAPLSR